jgi:hypothetical protein
MTSAPQHLPQTLEAAHAVIATLSEKLQATLRENELLKQKIDKLCRRLFGKSSEKVSPEQLALAFAQLPKQPPRKKRLQRWQRRAGKRSRRAAAPARRGASRSPSTCRASACW